MADDKKKNESHITPDRLKRFMDDDESIQYQEFIPGPNSPGGPPSSAGGTKTTNKEKK
jgi:hypothetical protein